MALPCFSFCFVVVSAAECVGPACPWSLGHWPAPILYLDRSFEKARGSSFGALRKMPRTGAGVSTIATGRILPRTVDSLEFCARASLYEGEFNNSTLEVSDGDEILRSPDSKV